MTLQTYSVLIAWNDSDDEEGEEAYTTIAAAIRAAEGREG